MRVEPGWRSRRSRGPDSSVWTGSRPGPTRCSRPPWSRGSAWTTGAGWPAAFAPPEDVAITRREIVNPLPRLRRRYATNRDVSYGEFGRRNRLDVWRRSDLADDAGAPVLIQVHGGAWVTGSKEQQGAPLMGHLAERGWVSVAVNYRLGPRSTWPDQIVDVKRAIAWVKEHIVEYGGDPDFVVITGGSAGGHLAALAALTASVGAFQPGFEDADTQRPGRGAHVRGLRLHQP